MKIQHPSKTRQRGAVLVISLLVLLVLTLLGISSLDNSVMEEKMASNAQTATKTFQKAESVIKQTLNTQNLDPTQIVSNAQAGTTVTYPVDDGIISSTRMAYPTSPNTVLKPAPNNSSKYVIRNVEIIGIANAGGIRSRNIQGYEVFPVPATP